MKNTEAPPGRVYYYTQKQKPYFCEYCVKTENWKESVKFMKSAIQMADPTITEFKIYFKKIKNIEHVFVSTQI